MDDLHIIYNEQYVMPYLFDGYNVYHTAGHLCHQWSHVTPDTLCQYIAEDMRRLDEHGVVVFDGARPSGSALEIEPRGYLRVVYAGGGNSADDLIEQMISDNTHPKRLSVVSSDRRIRKAARRRRAVSLASDDYLLALLAREDVPETGPREPEEKQQGLGEGQRNDWMELFGLDPEEPSSGEDFRRGTF